MAQQHQLGRPAPHHNSSGISGLTKHKKAAKGADDNWPLSSSSSCLQAPCSCYLPAIDAAVVVPVRAALLFVLAVTVSAAAYCALWATTTSTARNHTLKSIIRLAPSPNGIITSPSSSAVSSIQNLVTPPPPYLPSRNSSSHRSSLPPIACPASTRAANNLTCCSTPPLTSYANSPANNFSPAPTCPAYFRYIHDDLRPWKETGITRDALERARRTANFRLVILKGRAYVERYGRSFQSRDVFTIWGIVQLLLRYPGRVPDLELMFDCVDWPVVKAKDYRVRRGRPPPPVFRYCGDDETLDVVFPDWSFWGWPEINIKPWKQLLEGLREGNRRRRWIDREPYAYWKGNPMVAETRRDLLRCNVTEEQDWNARVFAQDWAGETRRGFKESDLASQCNYRYKIYIEGSAWSVSEKYILACDSLSLVVTPKYYDFFSRSLMPVHHYWPINTTDKCSSIKFAVNWGNSHKRKAQDIGREASRFVQEELTMDYVYDYMLHLLTEYARLLRFKPVVLPGAVEACAEEMVCRSRGLQRKFMAESMVNDSRGSGPCTLPPPFSALERKGIERRKENVLSQVEAWRRKGQEPGKRSLL